MIIDLTKVTEENLHVWRAEITEEIERRKWIRSVMKPKRFTSAAKSDGGIFKSSLSSSESRS